MAPDPTTPIAMGWRERVDLPLWHVRGVRAKIDTGARTSAIHVAGFEHLPNGRIRFEVVMRERPQRRTKWVEADIIRESVVKPSSGQPQVRPVVRTTLAIGPLEIETEVGLVCRQGMLCRMLVGRRTIAGLAVVDPSRTYVLTSQSAKSPARQPSSSQTPKATP
ncbi:MAG: ATP-dependent zinc protease [Phycisphaerales bacterium JB064]